MQVTLIKLSTFISSPEIVKANQMLISYFPYITDLSILEDVLHTICTQCAALTSCLGHPVYTQSKVGRLS